MMYLPGPTRVLGVGRCVEHPHIFLLESSRSQHWCGPSPHGVTLPLQVLTMGISIPPKGAGK